METLELIEQRLTRIEEALSGLNNKPKAGAYYTREDLRRLFHISFPTVDDWTRKGIFKSYRVGNRVFYHPDEVRAVIERRG